MARQNRSISIPIVLASVTVLLSIALLIAWTVLVFRYQEATNQFSVHLWLLVGGIVAFVLIGTVLVLFVFFLVREILEVRRQDSFIDSVTHELRSPLASLKLCLQTFEREDVPHEELQNLHNMMVKDVDRLTVFIEHILVASRMQYGKRTYKVSEVNLEEIIEQTIDRIAKRYKLTSDVFQIRLYSSGLLLLTDEMAMDTILTNLLDNAVKYSGSDVKVLIEVKEDIYGILILRITDNGIGIPQKSLKKIFDRFYRVPFKEVNKRKGTGLGLFVVASLIKSLGGKLKAFSDGYNKGATIEISLPAEMVNGTQRES